MARRGPKLPKRFEIRDADSRLVARTAGLGAAMLYAVRLAKERGRDSIIQDQRAEFGDVWLWIVRPNGALEPTERRSTASDEKELAPC